MRLINSKPDKFLVECIELDLYDIMYKANIPQTQGWDLNKEIDSLLQKYQTNGAIQKFDIFTAIPWEIIVYIYTPRKIKVHCQIP